jgi:hypothetical protein
LIATFSCCLPLLAFVTLPLGIPWAFFGAMIIALAVGMLEKSHQWHDTSDGRRGTGGYDDIASTTSIALWAAREKLDPKP